MAYMKVVEVLPPFAPAQTVEIDIDQYTIKFAKDNHIIRRIALYTKEKSALNGYLYMPKNLYQKALRCAYAIFKSTENKYKKS